MSRTNHRRISKRERNKLRCFCGHFNCWLLRERLKRTRFSERHFVIDLTPNEKRNRLHRFRQRREKAKTDE